jgi:hypothetical protein
MYSWVHVYYERALTNLYEMRNEWDLAGDRIRLAPQKKGLTLYICYFVSFSCFVWDNPSFLFLVIFTIKKLSIFLGWIGWEEGILD